MMSTPQPPRSNPRSTIGYLIALVLVTGVFVSANSELIRGDGFPRWDASKFYAPAYMLVADHAREGELLLWNPWMNGGRPDGADPQVGSFSPWTVALGWVTGGKPYGYIIYWLATWWLSILGVMLLARHLRAPPWGAVIAAAAFFSCGFFTGHAQHMSFIYSMAFLPWLVWRVDVALLYRDRWAAAQAGAIWGISALAGYPGMTILNFGFAGLWTIGRLCFPPDKTAAPWLKRLVDASVVWLWVVAVGLLALSPTYASFFAEGKGYSDRVDALSRKRAVESNALHPGAVTSLVSGHLGAVKGANRALWKYSDTSMVSVYTGAIALILALGVLWIAPRRVWYWWLLAVGLFFLLSAISQALPLRGWLYDYLPPMRYFRHSAIFRGPFAFALVVLALFGSRELEDRLKSKVAWIKVACLGLVFAPVSWWILTRLLGSELVSRPLELMYARQLAVALGLIPVLAAVIACLSPWPRLRRAMPWLLALAALADAWNTIELSESTMIVQNRIERGIWAEVEEAHVQELDVTAKGLERSGVARFGETVSNRGQAAKEAFFQSIDPFNNPYMVFWSGSDTLKSWVTSTDRIWFSPKAHPIPMSWDVFRTFIALGDKRGAPPLLIHPPELTAPEVAKEDRKPYLHQLRRELAALPSAERGLQVNVVAYRPDELVLHVLSPDDGWLWVTDRYTVGWRAEVNGQSREVHKANFLFRAVEVTEGFNEVRFYYRFAFYPHLLWLSWGTLLIVLIGSVLRAVSLKR